MSQVISLLIAHYLLIWFQLRADSGRLGNVVTFYALGFAGFYLVRPTVLALALDEPMLGPFRSTTNYQLIADSLFLLLVWQTLLTTTAIVTYRPGPTASWPVGGLPEHSVRRYGPTLLAILGFSTVLCIGLLAHVAGGLLNTVEASKIEKSFAGLFFLQFIPVTGMLISSRLAISIPRSRRSLFYWTTAVLFATAVMAWGSRRVLVVLLAIYIVHRMGEIDTQRLKGRRLVAYGASGAIAVAGIALSLRIIRDNAIGPNLGAYLEGQSVIRQVSMAMNAAYFEAFTLVVRDFPTETALWGLRPFTNGIAGVVPRALWRGKPSGVAIGAEFRQLYEPETLNGWPVGAPGEWLMGLGVVGMIVGALFSGLMLNIAGRAIARQGSLPYAAAFGLQVLELGFSGQSLVRWIGWVVPAALISLVLRGALRSPRRRTAWHPANAR